MREIQGVSNLISMPLKLPDSIVSFITRVIVGEKKCFESDRMNIYIVGSTCPGQQFFNCPRRFNFIDSPRLFMAKIVLETVLLLHVTFH